MARTVALRIGIAAPLRSPDRVARRKRWELRYRATKRANGVSPLVMGVSASRSVRTGTGRAQTEPGVVRTTPRLLLMRRVNDTERLEDRRYADAVDRIDRRRRFDVRVVRGRSTPACHTHASSCPQDVEGLRSPLTSSATLSYLLVRR